MAPVSNPFTSSRTDWYAALTPGSWFVGLSPQLHCHNCPPVTHLEQNVTSITRAKMWTLNQVVQSWALQLQQHPHAQTIAPISLPNLR